MIPSYLNIFVFNKGVNLEITNLSSCGIITYVSRKKEMVVRAATKSKRKKDSSNQYIGMTPKMSIPAVGSKHGYNTLRTKSEYVRPHFSFAK